MKQTKVVVSPKLWIPKLVAQEVKAALGLVGYTFVTVPAGCVVSLDVKIHWKDYAKESPIPILAEISDECIFTRKSLRDASVFVEKNMPCDQIVITVTVTDE